MLHYIWSMRNNRSDNSSSDDDDGYPNEDLDNANEDFSNSNAPSTSKNTSMNLESLTSPHYSFISNEFNAESAQQRKENSTKSENNEHQNDQIIRDTGIITRLDLSMPKGIIDRKYQFEIAKFCSSGEFQELQKVDFEAIRSKLSPFWTVTSMKLHVPETEQRIREIRKHKLVTGTIESVDANYVNVCFSEGYIQKIPNRTQILPDYPLLPGDWVSVKMENLEENKNLKNDVACDETVGKIISVKPTRKKTIFGKVTKMYNEFCIDNEIYFSNNVVQGNRKSLTINTPVHCTAVESYQKVAEGTFQWRATEVKFNNLMHFNDDLHNRDEFGAFNVTIPTIQYNEMYQDRNGVTIKPFIVFIPKTKVGSWSSQRVTIINLSDAPVQFCSLKFPNAAAQCKFELELPNKKPFESPDVIKTLDVKDDLTFFVFGQPLQVGTTREIGILDFGTFKIARDFKVTGLATEDKLIKSINQSKKISFRLTNMKLRGDKEISRIMDANDRMRVRGQAPVRAPFFSPKKIPPEPVPKEIWIAKKTESEDYLRKYFPGAVKPTLNMENYEEKFKVALWFEEVEHDRRRRMYDLHKMRLRRRGEDYYFEAKGVQEIQPPVLVGDPIDVYDSEDSSNIKYQGHIQKIVGNEVLVHFSENFNQIYQGQPLTISFCVSRMVFKRQHYAVKQAVKFLGEDFLFPFNYWEIEIKEARISYVEASEDAEGPSGDAEIPESVGLFKPPRAGDFSSVLQDVKSSGSKRVQSISGRFKSTVNTTCVSEEVTLRWFNTNLNKEQKNAVRYILRGQARPLPYIIYGPPGTGKTVTMVEAAMQVHKLDSNSRILISTPTNHAADIISEHLINFGKFVPGDFVRFNGFLRQEQVSNDIIKCFCVDGENLEKVARHRLIVSTCATAGQFFNLDIGQGHFTHVFIDEAGYCTEPETMICAANLSLESGGQLILAGDPNQLGPVLMCDVAQNLNLNVSFLERLMVGKRGVPNIYSRNTEQYGNDNHGYNSMVLTLLVRNYRAHPLLLKLPSDMFYYGSLVSNASEQEILAVLENKKLQEPPNSVLLQPNVPIVFCGVQGTSTRDPDSPSWFNPMECVCVVNYVQKLRNAGLSNDDIGIITPYRKQAEKIRIALKCQILTDELPKVGSVEEFQGGERKVVIVSTVRSHLENKIDSSVLSKFSFIYNQKRFNVTITRAKALMIVVGNPHVLYQDSRWREFLLYCIQLKVTTGCNLPKDCDPVVQALYAAHKKSVNSEVKALPPTVSTESYNADNCDDDED